jgi:precorrin-6B methylase 2
MQEFAVQCYTNAKNAYYDNSIMVNTPWVGALMIPSISSLNLSSGDNPQDFFWGCLPFVATPPEVVHRMLELAKVNPSDIVMDLGCGDCRILLSALSDFGAKMAVGYEIRGDLIKDALDMFESKNLIGRVKLIKGDLLGADLSEASVIAIYLTGTGNDRLRSKFEEEVKPGTRIVSHDFGVDGWKPAKIERFGGHEIFLYIVPGAFKRNNRKYSLGRLKFWARGADPKVLS